MNPLPNLIDLRSDTITKPTPEMLQVMLQAQVGDDVYGEDETTQMLEQKLAKMFHLEAGLFCASGTMANQIGIKCLTQPMEEIICEQYAHIYRYEVGGLAFHSGLSTRLIKGVNGILSPELIENEINIDDIHYPKTSLLALENTANKAGGTCYTLKDIAPIHHLCNLKGLKLHLDGARIFNALVATGDDSTAYGKYFDTISICLSKGLGAPVGSVLLGSHETIHKARKIRKAMGGGMRQTGYFAAAGLYAIENHVDRLVEDHEKAYILATELQKCNLVEEVLPVQTNIVIFKVFQKSNTDEIIKKLKTKGLLCNAFGPQLIRLVTHLDFKTPQLEPAIQILKTVLHT